MEAAWCCFWGGWDKRVRLTGDDDDDDDGHDNDDRDDLV